MDLNTTWFLLIGVLIAGYAILDGFDLGVGTLHLFTRREQDKQVMRHSIEPVWDGNEVWLVTAGGALFAAFPIVYATVFSGFYLAFMLLLFALIFRAVSLEFHGQVDSAGWRRCWDWGFGLGSLLPAILFGVAVGNVLRGLPILENGSLEVAFVSLLNPYSLLIGVLSFVMCVMHGAAYLTLKTEGALQDRMATVLTSSWIGFILMYLAATIATVFVSPFLFEGLQKNPLFWIFLLLLLAAISYIPIATRAKAYLRAFLASATTIGSMIALAAISLFPRMVPSNTDLAHSLTIYNASSSPTTLTTMLVIALLGMPLVLVYSAYVYVVFKGKATHLEEGY
jgi:cytochrome d ubiquinol oxidase subunit II